MKQVNYSVQIQKKIVKTKINLLSCIIKNVIYFL